MRAFVLLAVVFMVQLPLNLNAQAKPRPWHVADEYKHMKNPVARNEASIKAGQVLYIKHCVACHGKTGFGDGVRSKALKTFSGDFSGDGYQNQTDGEHFYKTKFGRGEMPRYEGKLSDEEI